MLWQVELIWIIVGCLEVKGTAHTRFKHGERHLEIQALRAEVLQGLTSLLECATLYPKP